MHFLELLFRTKLLAYADRLGDRMALELFDMGIKKADTRGVLVLYKAGLRLTIVARIGKRVPAFPFHFTFVFSRHF